MTAERFHPDRLVEQACELAGSDDFGDDDTWRDGLARLCDGLVSEARLNDLGVEIAVLDIMRPLTSRLQIVKWRKENPDVAAQPDHPADLHRGPAPHRDDDPVRPARPGSRASAAADMGGRQPLSAAAARRPTHTDPRIAETQASIEMSEQIVPGLLAFHPMGALVGSGVRAHHRRRVLQHDLLGAVPAAQLLPVAAVRGRPSTGLRAIIECFCSTCSLGCRGNGC